MCLSVIVADIDESDRRKHIMKASKAGVNQASLVVEDCENGEGEIETPAKNDSFASVSVLIIDP